MAPFQVHQRLLALLFVNVENEETALLSCHDSDIRIRPEVPPFADSRWIGTTVFRAVFGSGMFARGLTARLAARAAARSRRMEWDHKPTTLCIAERRARAVRGIFFRNAVNFSRRLCYILARQKVLPFQAHVATWAFSFASRQASTERRS
jgi:hypothetical protein